MSTEERVIFMFLALHIRFPPLTMICEHLNAAVAIEAVQKCGPTL